MAQYKDEFPDFELDIGKIPEGFEDRSWHNDACPSWHNPTLRLTLFVDYRNEKDREFPGSDRFSLFVTDEEGIMSDLDDENAFFTNDWSAILKHIEKEKETPTWTDLVEVDVHLLARVFSFMLFDEVGKSNMDQINIRNSRLPEGICASHDFCDSNMVMHDAYSAVIGSRDYEFCNQVHTDNRNRAWDIAFHAKFYPHLWED